MHRWGRGGIKNKNNFCVIDISPNSLPLQKEIEFVARANDQVLGFFMLVICCFLAANFQNNVPLLKSALSCKTSLIYLTNITRYM